jgi:hypothetical protein
MEISLWYRDDVGRVNFGYFRDCEQEADFSRTEIVFCLFAVGKEVSGIDIFPMPLNRSVGFFSFQSGLSLGYYLYLVRH